MDWEQIKKDFEKWRKNFLAGKPRVNDKRRDLEPTGNEPPPDVYGQKSFGKALEEQLHAQNQEYVFTYGYAKPTIYGATVDRHKLREEPIVVDDITDIKIALGNSEDVNDFIEEI